jgi:hypothetical protein
MYGFISYSESGDSMGKPGNQYHLGGLRSILVTRKAGETAQNAIFTALDQNNEAVLFLNFTGVEVIDYSFADAAVAKTVSRLIAGELGNKFLVLTNLRPEWSENIDVALKQRQLPALATQGSDWQVLGWLKDYLLQTLVYVVQQQSVTARDLAEASNLSVNAANNRLSELHRLKLLQRSELIPPGGGKLFVYISLVAPAN